MSLDKTYITEVDLSTDNSGDTVITSVTGSTAQLSATSFLSGPAGTDGSDGTDGLPGPNQVTVATASNLNGLLKANGTNVNTAAPGTDYVTPTGSGAGLTGITESQITNLTSDLAALAPIVSPALSGTPTAPTPAPTDNSTKLATTEYVTTAILDIATNAPVVLTDSNGVQWTLTVNIDGSLQTTSVTTGDEYGSAYGVAVYA